MFGVHEAFGVDGEEGAGWKAFQVWAIVAPVDASARRKSMPLILE